MLMKDMTSCYVCSFKAEERSHNIYKHYTFIQDMSLPTLHERQERSQKQKKIHFIIDTLVKEAIDEGSSISDLSDEEYSERLNSWSRASGAA